MTCPAWRALASERSGSVATLTALASLVLVGFAALAVDVEQFYVAKRRLQAAADLAAMAAAADLDRAEANAAASVVSNGFPASVVAMLERGTYTGDADLAPDRRFSPGSASGANAVRISATTSVPMIFGKAFMPGSGSVSVGARAVGVTGDALAFSLQSRLVGVDADTTNAVLGGLLGGPLGLTSSDYGALASTGVDLFATADAIAGAVHLAGDARYADLQARDIGLSALIDALGAAVAKQGATVPALNALAAAAGGSGGSVRVGRLMSFGPFASRSIGSGAPFNAQVDVLSLVTAAAQLARAGQSVDISLATTQPGILALRLALAVGEPPVGSGVVALGARGTTLHTAQIRLSLTARLSAAPPLLAVDLPLYVEIASGTARIASIACPVGDVAEAAVDLGVMPGVVEGWIGTVPKTDMTSFSASTSPAAATLASLSGLASVTGRAHASVSDTREATLRFTRSDIAAHNTKTVSTTDYTATLLASLASSLRVDVTALGLGFGVPPGLATSVQATIGAALPVLDRTLSTTLSSLGITLGDADATVEGLRCGEGILAN